MKCKNKEIAVKGLEYNGIAKTLTKKTLYCICSNDENGKTLSIHNGTMQFSIPFEEVAECFKGDYKK